MAPITALGQIALAMELARPEVDADQLEILEIDGRTIWPASRESDSYFAFYIGRKGSPTWDANAWVEVPLDLPPAGSALSEVGALAIVTKAIVAGIEKAKALP